MKLLSVIVFLVLSTIAALHVYWAVGGLWPGGNERELIDTVIGDGAMTHMPPMMMTLVVAGLIFATALIALVNGGVQFGPSWLVKIAAVGAGLVFLGRGVAGYFFETVAWAPVEPFATLNRVYYSPLCLAIGVAFFFLALRAPQHTVKALS